MLLYRLNRATYSTLRNTLLATWLLSLPVYALYPAAPPRLAGLGIVDTVSTGSPLKLEGGTTTSLFNQFAAVPSLHVGFAFAIGIALAAALRNPILRVAALMWGPVMLLTVVATGNHFVFDAITGVAITGAGYGVHRLIAAGWPARRRVETYARSPCRPVDSAAAARVSARRTAATIEDVNATPDGAPVLVAVNVGTPADVRVGDRIVSTAIWKEPVSGRVAVRGVNLAGDDQADRSVHGGPDKAVYAYARGGRGVVGARLGRDLGPAPFGENLTTRASTSAARSSASAGRSAARCSRSASRGCRATSSALRMGDPRFVKRVRAGADGRAPTWRIVREGELGAGDAVEIAHRPDHDVTVALMHRALLQDHRLLPELLAAPELMPRWRAFVLERTGALDQAR